MVEKYSYCLDGDIPPILSVNIGENFCIETENAFGGKIKNEEQLCELINCKKHHPLTGPIFIKNVHSGDNIEVTIVDISIKDPAYQCLSRSSGVLSLQPFIRNFKKISICEGYVNFDNVSFDARPSLGVIGTATKEKTRSGRLGNSGGNIDIKELCIGSKIILPCSFDGGLLYVGDMHLIQGNGEISGIAAEARGYVTLCVNISAKKYKFPILCLKNGMNFIGYGESIEASMVCATENALQYLCQEFQIKVVDAYMIIGIIGNLILGHSTGKIVSCGVFIETKDLDKLNTKREKRGNEYE